MDRVWLRVGKLCERCRSERLYRELGFERFDAWISDAVGWSRSRAYVAMRAARDLVPIRDAELDKITMQNADILSRVPKSKQAALVEAAVIQTEREFRKTVEATVPGLHLEDMVHVEFWVPRSLAEVIERCIEKAKVLNLTDSRTAAIEAIFAEYDVGHVDPEKEREAERQEVS
jgi:predicted transcriptional regulator